MPNDKRSDLAVLLKTARAKSGFTAKEVADRAGIADSNILRIESGDTANPRPNVLKAIADALRLDLADVYAAAGYVQPTGLPSFAPYLRSKYSNLPAKAQRELEQSFAAIADKYGYEADGPAPGEDER